MNPYTKNINRIEFLVTLACTGRCKHCSEGEHKAAGENIDGNAAAQMVHKVTEKYKINSLMTFGGEPLLHPDVVCKIHTAARETGIPKRQLITNGFFSRDTEKIQEVVRMLAESGINNILLSVDAFHQETIPLEPVKLFAKAIYDAGIPVRTNPAWLVGENADNPYNKRTREILQEFALLGIVPADGNIISPSGNALKYLEEYFDLSQGQVSPYEEDPEDIRAICIDPNGDVLGGNIYQKDILEILEKYTPDQLRNDV